MRWGNLHALSLCAGIAGLDLGIQLAVPGSRTVGYVEREGFAANIILDRMEDEALEPAPIFHDIREFDGRPWAGAVDLITAGYPCQPFSFAGSRKGEADERHLWPEVARVVREVRPELVFLENVPGHIRLGFDRVLADLAELGFDAEWGLFSAAEVGAPHKRERLFILAYRNCWGCGGERFSRLLNGIGEEFGDNANGCGLRSEGPVGEAMAYANGARREGAQPARIPSQGREEPVSFGPFPPGPSGDWGGVPPEAKPAIRGMANGPSSRVDRLRALGNGVVPLAAAHAFRTLAARAGLT